MQNNNNIETLLSNGKYQEAAVMLSRGLMARPKDPDLLTQMARLHFLRKSGDASLACFQKALQSAPGHVPALLGLGELYLAANQPGLARQQFQQAAKRAPGCAAAWRALANVYVRVGEVEQAGPYLKKAVEVEPENQICRLELGRWLAYRGAFGHAELHLRKCLSANPDDNQVLVLLGDVLWRQEKNREAHACYLRVKEEPHLSLAQARIVNCLLVEEKVGEALELVDDLLAADNPHRTELLSLKAHLHLVRGEKAIAKTVANDLVREAPDHVDGWETHVQLSPEDVDDVHVSQLRRLVAEAPHPESRAKAGFILSRYYDWRGDVDQEMSVLEEANALKATQCSYTPWAQEKLLDMVRVWLQRNEKKADSCPVTLTPVFVLGLPRSGTTLVEQILTSHRLVEGSGESLAFKHALPGDIVELLQRPDDEWVTVFRDRYIEYQKTRGFTSGLVVDKAITHFLVAGVLARAFPHAHFIAVHRHPLDVCLGGWKRHFTTGPEWVYTKDGLAHSCRLYSDSIRTWASAGVPVLEVNYEDLVGAPEEWVPRLARHLRLEPEPGMYSPGDNNRTILTSSTAQVRGEIDARYANRWRRYEPHLGPFISALEKAGVEVPGLEAKET